jgi:hypothetical protein
VPEAKVFTRKALYELVWSRPRTALAKELGISDVAITKHCRAARIPTPAVGYWMKVNAGRKAVRFPLPPRLPGESDVIVMGGEQVRWHWPPTGALMAEPEPTPPAFLEDIEQQVAEIVKRMGRVRATRDLSTPERSLARILEAEAKRREGPNHRYSWEKPRYDGPLAQRHLRIFNSICRAVAPIYGLQGVSEADEWIRGQGTLHHLVLHLNFAGTGMRLRVHEPGEPRRERGAPPVKVSTLRVEPGGLELPVLEWQDLDGQKIEGQLTSILGALVRRAEVALRAHEQWNYERRCRQRNDVIEAIEKRKDDAERKRLEAIVAQNTKVRNEVIELSRRRRTAEDIRATVASLRTHPEVNTTAGRARYQAWAANALAVADAIDPMNLPLEEALGSYAVEEHQVSPET